MALTRSQIRNIATDARNLHDELMDQGVPLPAATEWVKGAMLGIVMHEVEVEDEEEQQRQARELNSTYGREDPDAG